MKIEVLGIHGFPNVQGGPEVHSQNPYPLLVKRGYEVVVFTRKAYVDESLTSYKGVITGRDKLIAFKRHNGRSRA